jgi:hypothetical protein
MPKRTYHRLAAFAIAAPSAAAGSPRQSMGQRIGHRGRRMQAALGRSRPKRRAVAPGRGSRSYRLVRTIASRTRDFQARSRSAALLRRCGFHNTSGIVRVYGASRVFCGRPPVTCARLDWIFSVRRRKSDQRSCDRRSKTARVTQNLSIDGLLPHRGMKKCCIVGLFSTHQALESPGPPGLYLPSITSAVISSLKAQGLVYRAIFVPLPLNHPPSRKIPTQMRLDISDFFRIATEANGRWLCR